MSPLARLGAAVALLVSFVGGGAAAWALVGPDAAGSDDAIDTDVLGAVGGDDGAAIVASSSSSTTTTTTTTTTAPPRSATLAFTGDLLPHSPVTRQAQANAGGTGWDFGPMFDLVRDRLSAVDLAICHLETPLSPDGTDISGYPVFNAPRELAEAARDAGYDGCSLASNHAYDRGRDGVLATVAAMDAVGLGSAGMADSAARDLEPVLYDAGGITIGHVSATYGLNGFVLPDSEPWLVDLIEPAEVIAEAAAARAAGAEFVVVSLHWGDEYVSAPSAAQEAWLAEILPSPEVDLVIGHHAHVVQPVDRVGDEFVVYGLGNFLSNQSANCCTAATQDGMIAEVELVEPEPGRIVVEAVRWIPTWVDRSDYTIVDVAEALADPATPADRRATLEASLARTAEVVTSRLGPDRGLVPVDG